MLRSSSRMYHVSTSLPLSLLHVSCAVLPHGVHHAVMLCHSACREDGVTAYTMLAVVFRLLVGCAVLRTEYITPLCCTHRPVGWHGVTAYIMISWYSVLLVTLCSTLLVYAACY